MGALSTTSVDPAGRVRGKRIVIVGGGREAVPGIRRAKELGLHVIVTDGDSNCPGAVEADRFLTASTYDPLATISELDKLREHLHGAICIATDVPVTVAEIAQRYGLPGISVEAAITASDKLAMKESLAKDEIPIPWFASVSSAEQLNRLRGSDRRLIVKPVDSRGARGVVRLLREVTSAWAYQEALRHSPSGRVIVEEFLEGPQISSESLVIDGIATTVGLADRNYENLDRFAPFVVEDGGELPANVNRETERAIHELIQGAARTLDIRTGVIKGDIVIHKGIPYIIEVAARLSGGYFCTHEIPLSTGVDLVGAAIMLAVGERPDGRALEAKFHRHVAQRYVFPRQGRVIAVRGLSEVSGRTGIELCEIRVGLGDIVMPIDSHPARAGVVIATGSNRLDARTRAVAAVNALQVETAID